MRLFIRWIINGVSPSITGVIFGAIFMFTTLFWSNAPLNNEPIQSSLEVKLIHVLNGDRSRTDADGDIWILILDFEFGTETFFAKEDDDRGWYTWPILTGVCFINVFYWRYNEISLIFLLLVQ